MTDKELVNSAIKILDPLMGVGSKDSIAIAMLLERFAMHANLGFDKSIGRYVWNDFPRIVVGEDGHSNISLIEGGNVFIGYKNNDKYLSTGDDSLNIGREV